jgi:hypothetical protein
MQAQTNAFVFLVEHDPRQAMQLASDYEPAGRLSAMSTVFRNWHRRDPEAAERWMDAAPDADRRELFPALVSVRTAEDPAAAWELATSRIPDRGRLPGVLPPVFSAWLNQDAAAARAALVRAPPDVWQPEFASVAGTMLGESRAPDLDSLASKIPGPVRAPFWAGVADGSIGDGKDPARAAEAFAQLPPDCDDRMTLAERITEEWLRRDNPEAASEWVRSLPPDRARDFAAAALAEGLTLTDPEAAAVWARDIRDESMRESVLKRMGISP